MKRVCDRCGAEYERKRKDSKHCSRPCRDAARRDTDSSRASERERNERRKEYKQQWRINNPDKVKASKDLRDKRERDAKIRAYLVSPSHCTDCSKPQPWERRNRQRCVACEATHVRKQSNEWVKRRYHANPNTKASMIAAAHRRRARKLSVEHEDIDPLTVFERDAWRCQRLGCGKVTRLDVDRKAGNRAVLGHINALAAGGSHTYDNVCCLCHPCNAADGVNKEAIQYSLAV